MPQRPTGPPEHPSGGRRRAEGLRELRGQDQDRRGGGEAGDHRVAHQVGDHAQAEHSQEQSGDADHQGQQGGQGHVVGATGVGQAGKGTEGEQAGERHGPRLEVRRGGEQGGQDRRQRRCEQPDVGWQTCQLGVRHRLGDQHHRHAQPGQQVGGDRSAGGRDQGLGAGSIGHPGTLGARSTVPFAAALRGSPSPGPDGGTDGVDAMGVAVASGDG